MLQSLTFTFIVLSLNILLLKTNASVTFSSTVYQCFEVFPPHFTREEVEFMMERSSTIQDWLKIGLKKIIIKVRSL